MSYEALSCFIIKLTTKPVHVSIPLLKELKIYKGVCL